jgi:putative transcriptional regulator
MTDRAIAKELGNRLKQRRLNKDLSQKQVSVAAGMSITAVQGAERGETTILTLIKILRVLRSLDALDAVLPVMEVSPLTLARLEGKKRRKASGKRQL